MKGPNRNGFKVIENVIWSSNVMGRKTAIIGKDSVQ